MKGKKEFRCTVISAKDLDISMKTANLLQAAEIVVNSFYGSHTNQDLEALVSHLSYSVTTLRGAIPKSGLIKKI